MPTREPRSDYERIIETVIERIRTGAYPPATRIPSISQLAAEFGVSAATVVSAERTLRREGHLRGHPGKGVFVADGDDPPAGEATPPQ